LSTSNRLRFMARRVGQTAVYTSEYWCLLDIQHKQSGSSIWCIVVSCRSFLNRVFPRLVILLFHLKTTVVVFLLSSC
jgi:hypothetical protein